MAVAAIRRFMRCCSNRSVSASILCGAETGRMGTAWLGGGGGCCWSPRHGREGRSWGTLVAWVPETIITDHDRYRRDRMGLLTVAIRRVVAPAVRAARSNDHRGARRHPPPPPSRAVPNGLSQRLNDAG